MKYIKKKKLCTHQLNHSKCSQLIFFQPRVLRNAQIWNRNFYYSLNSHLIFWLVYYFMSYPVHNMCSTAFRNSQYGHTLVAEREKRCRYSLNFPMCGKYLHSVEIRYVKNARSNQIIAIWEINHSWTFCHAVPINTNTSCVVNKYFIKRMIIRYVRIYINLNGNSTMESLVSAVCIEKQENDRE